MTHAPARWMLLALSLAAFGCTEEVVAGGPDAGAEEPADAAAAEPPDASEPPDSGTPDGGGPTRFTAGTACAKDADCYLGRCAKEADGFPGGYCTADCHANAPVTGCATGEFCSDTQPGDTSDLGTCVKSCGADTECRQGYVCDTKYLGRALAQKACVPGDRTKKVGDACAYLGGCAPGDFCLTEKAAGEPGGYCTRGCSTANAGVCGNGNQCVDFDPNDGKAGGVCLKSCAQDNECRTPGYICDTTPAPGVTLTTKACMPGTRGKVIGDACATNGDCAPGDYCATESSAGFPGGYCTRGCDTTNGATCGTAAFCTDSDPTDTKTAGYCLKTCAAKSECRAPGYQCDTHLASLTITQKACVPGSDTATAIGAPCKHHGECLDTQYCAPPSAGFPDGYCSASCGTDGDCGGDAKCLLVDSAKNTRACFDGCNQASDCRSGGRYGCASRLFGQALTSQVCLPFDPAASIGSACTVFSDCTLGQFCLPERKPNGDPTGFRGNYCSGSCSTSGDCGGDGVCVIPPGSTTGYCLDGCASSTDCRTAEHYGCTSRIEGYELGQKVCFGYSPTAHVGDACFGGFDCTLGGLCLKQTPAGSLPNGYCTEVCTVTPADSCPTDAFCFAAGGTAVCLDGCAQTSECRAAEAYKCKPAGASGKLACLP